MMSSHSYLQVISRGLFALSSAFGERHSCKSKVITGDLSRALLWAEILLKTSPIKTGIIENIERHVGVAWLGAKRENFFLRVSLLGSGVILDILA